MSANTTTVFLNLAFDRRRGLWASETAWFDDKGKQRRVRQAGQLPAQSSRHTLQVVALMAGLRIVPVKSRQAILYRTKQRRISTAVLTRDESLPIAWKSIDDALRISPNFKHALNRARNGIGIWLKAAPDNGALLALEAWMQSTIVAPSLSSDIDRVTRALAVQDAE